jgi:hypothetical protein
LAAAYRGLKAEGKSVEIVFASADKDAASFHEYFGTMPWLAIPFDQVQTFNERADRFGSGDGIPHLVWLDGKTGTGCHALNHLCLVFCFHPCIASHHVFFTPRACSSSPGQEITREGVSIVRKHGGRAFPFTAAAVDFAEAAVLRNLLAPFDAWTIFADVVDPGFLQSKEVRQIRACVAPR